MLNTAVFLFSSVCVIQCLDQLDYYVQLVTNETSRAYKNPPPKNAYQHIPLEKGYNDYGVFDHIIVGAGTAGCVIANRLSEDNFRHVLLLEAGGYENNFTDIPAMSAYSAGLEYNWGYLSVPQSSGGLGLKNHQCPIPRGKVIGGSSTINGLAYVRGSKVDYDNWYKEGNYGWSYKDVLPYFKKSENFSEGDARYRGQGGYLNVKTWNEINPQVEAFIDANKMLGIKEIDYNGEEQLGIGKVQFKIKDGKRHSSGRAFLSPVMHRQNLKVLTNSYVVKILISKRGKAFGVLFTRNGKIYIATSRQDVIVSAGVIGSPQLLMLSGIGPRQHLQTLNIPVVQDLPVGEHLEDHVGMLYMDFVTNYTEPQTSLETNLKNYFNGEGILSNALNAHVAGYYQTKYANIPGQPDVEIVIAPSINTNDIFDKFWNIEESTADFLLKNSDPQRSFTLYGLVLQPKSKGYLQLKSSNPFDYPLINPNILSDEKGEDIETLYQIIELMMKLISTPPLQKLNTKLKYPPLPACKDYEYLSRDYWYCFIRQLSVSVFHPIATCKMGSHPSKGAVVSPELKVFGISNLRVADTSVIPLGTSGHTGTIAMMIGEKLADLVKGKVQGS
ncbi:hypothetical protein RI129_007924 [Pyrocoelia pectoralis]|uniref:Glucose-methanol-choline oxidoreductase N-terminal domain-containing protein n=1 Tax=Pyrocoelia pectoralis TaxID=417401 RepID=A0AAN7VD88_9COLE